jgi:transcriptional regulator GlxA family with amidase domain
LIAELLTRILSADKTATRIPQFTSKQKRYYMPLVENVKSYMNLNLTEDISLPTLAQESNMSVFHFNRLFKKITGFTPYKYLLHMRLQHASQQIINTSDSITDIAFASGFASLEHFSASFKEHFGMPPSAGRR